MFFEITRNYKIQNIREIFSMMTLIADHDINDFML